MKRIYKTGTTNQNLANFSINHVYVIAAFSLLVGAALGYLWKESTSKQIVHIQSDQVFKSFTLTQELEAKLNNTRQSRELVLGNLAMRIQDMNKQGVSKDSVAVMQNEYQKRELQFGQDNQLQAEAFDTQIWTQLNQYIQDYCSENGYSYILGSTGNGNLMGADPDMDMTESIITYVNDRYAGKI